MNVLVAGFQHETNTFAPTKADWAAFQAGSGYPAYSRGAAMLERLGASSQPLAGFMGAARERGWQLLPSVWAGAMPSAQVTRDAFERIAAALIEDLERALAAGQVDAVYLDLHGAAVTEHLDDAEGELMARVRERIGPDRPLVASLDLHANVTERMLRQASAMTAFRSYPHVDMPATGARAAALLEALVRGAHWSTRHVRLPFLLPLNTQCTLIEPAASVMARLGALEAQHGVHLSFAMGFPAADFAECGPVVFGHGPDGDAVQRAVHALAEEAVSRRAEWALQLPGAREAVGQALAWAEGDEAGPVIIADTQDNPGAGGDANTTGLLHALLAAGAGLRWPGRVALGLLHDPQAAATAQAAGVGALLELRLGRAVPTYGGGSSDTPVLCRCVVRAVSDGHVLLQGPMTGGPAALGPSACVDVDGVLVLLTTNKCQLYDLDLCRFLGVEPEHMKLIVAKSSVHFRAAFGPIASHIIVAKAPGPMAADPADLPWRKLPSAIARRP